MSKIDNEVTNFDNNQIGCCTVLGVCARKFFLT